MAMFNKEVIRLETERLVIRPLKPADVTEDYVRGLNDPDVNKYLCLRGEAQTFESVRAYVEQNDASATAILFGIFFKTDKKLIGTVRLANMSYFHYFMDLGVCLFDKAYWRRGLGSEALMRIREFAFGTLGFHYIEAGIYADNLSSRKLFEKSGFECFERIEDKYRYEDKFVPVLMYRAVNRDFQLPQREGCDEYIGTGRN